MPTRLVVGVPLGRPSLSSLARLVLVLLSVSSLESLRSSNLMKVGPRRSLDATIMSMMSLTVQSPVMNC